MLKLEHAGDAQFTCFLNSKGRTLAECTISRVESPDDSPSFLLDVDNSVKSTLFKHLRLFKLRSKLELTDVSDSYTVSALLPTNPFSQDFSVSKLFSKSVPEHPQAMVKDFRARYLPSDTSSYFSMYIDPRATRMGLRFIAPKHFVENVQQDSTFSAASVTDYHKLRVLLGIPEGSETVDIIPLEWGLTFLRGVSFNKGCYLGQELVARAHFRGMIRKRLLPVLFEPSADAADIYYVDSYACDNGAASCNSASSIQFPLPQILSNSGIPAPVLDENISGSFINVNDPPTGEQPSGRSAARMGKLLSVVPGLNVGFASMRLENMIFTLRKEEDSTNTDSEFPSMDENYSSFNADLPTYGTFSLQNGTGVDAGEFSEGEKSSIVQHTSVIESQLASMKSTLSIPTSDGSTSLRLSPILPLWWRHISPSIFA